MHSGVLLKIEVGIRYTSEATRGLGSVVVPLPHPAGSGQNPGRKLVLVRFEFERSHLVSTNLLSLSLLLHIKFDFIWSRAFNQSAFYPRVSATLQQCDNLWITLLDEVKSSEPTEDTSDLAAWVCDDSLTSPSWSVACSWCQRWFHCFQLCYE